MLKVVAFGEAPYLDIVNSHYRKFDHYYAFTLGASIEQQLQEHKQLEVPWQERRGIIPPNLDACREYYFKLWDRYFWDHPYHKTDLLKFNGFIYPAVEIVTPAEYLYRVRGKYEKSVVVGE